MLLNCGVGEDSWESLGLQGDPTRPSWRRSVLGVHWRDWCWSWNSNPLATWCKELTHWKRPWFWERLKGGGKGDDRGWDGWMASLTQWTWVWVDSGSWWWTGRPGMLWFMGSQRVKQKLVTQQQQIINQTYTCLLAKSLQSCPTLCNSMNHSTPGLPVHHQLPEFTQTHVHQVGDAIQPSHPLSSPSPALNLSQHQGLFKWVRSLHQMAKVLEFQLQHQYF